MPKTKKKPFTEALIKHIRIKFQYELESNVYTVAAYLDATQLHDCSNRSFAVHIILKAKTSMQDIANEMLFKQTQIETDEAAH